MQFSSLTEATKHLAKKGDKTGVTLETHHVDTGESVPLRPASLTKQYEATEQEQSLS